MRNRRCSKVSLVPAFEVGVWNAWLLMLPLVLIPAIMASVKKGLFKKTESTANLSKTEKRVFVFSKVFLILSFLYSIFLPLKLGTLWFYVGLPISLLGIAMYIVVSVNIANTPVGEPVTTGLYRYSRHPMYVASFPALVGAGIASASWLFLLLAILVTVTHFLNGIFEERLCLAAYGSVYQKYLNRTPRWIGVQKST
jgi:protein-S-isoprenylcysteine O-methyltransferase Ste14